MTSVRLHVASTAMLPPSLLPEMRHLLDASFGGAFSDSDWQHAIAGIHVWITDDGGRIISHATLAERTLTCGCRSVSAGYVEAVVTAAGGRRKGYGAMVMSRVGALIRGQYELGALSTGAHRFYEALGWERWCGPTFVNTSTGIVRTPDDDGGVMILRTPRSPELDLHGDMMCDWRVGDVW